MRNQRPRLPQIQDVWVEECSSFCLASDLSLCRPFGRGVWRRAIPTRAVVAKPNFGGQAWRKIRAISPVSTP
jgi:hypothetical protein